MTALGDMAPESGSTLFDHLSVCWQTKDDQILNFGYMGDGQRTVWQHPEATARCGKGEEALGVAAFAQAPASSRSAREDGL